MFQIVTCVLQLGNLSFVDGPVDSNSGLASAVLTRPSMDILQHCSTLLQVDSTVLQHALTEKVIQMGRSSLVGMFVLGDSHER